MTFKRIMLFASMAMAAVAFAAPAARAHAPEWYYEGVKVGGQGNEIALHVQGSLSSTVVGGGSFISGPCLVTFEGIAWNENGMADGQITGGNIQSACETNTTDCHIVATLQSFPWYITGVTITGEPGIEIVGVQFQNHYESTTVGGCPVPVSTITAKGTATGIVESNHRCLNFEQHTDDMLTQAPLPPLTVDIQGTACEALGRTLT